MHHRNLLAWPLPPKLTAWQSVAIGAGILFIAVLLRLGLDHVIPGRLAFTTYFPAVVLATYVTGAPGGLVVLAGGLVGSWFTWIDPMKPLNVAVVIIGDSVFGITGAILILALAALRAAIFELAEQDERIRVINRELMHRNCNQFAIVTSLAVNTLKRAGIDGRIAASLRDRIEALARAQELISLNAQRTISLERLVRRVLVPIVPEPYRLIVAGIWVDIAAAQVSGLALVLHELGTNALKYGAWSNSSGCVTVDWQRTPSGIAITWQEQGGPPIALPQNSGLGSVLIEGGIPGANVERAFEPSGLRIVLRVPLQSTQE